MNMKSSIFSIIHNDLKEEQVFIQDHCDPSFIGLSGLIEKETRNMIIIQTDKEVAIPKEGGVFVFSIEGKDYSISGVNLLGDQKKRTKKRIRRW